MKEVNFFTHDYGARNDPKLIDVQMDMGGQGLAIWWCLVEMLWEQGGYIPRNYKSLAFCLRWATADEVRHLVEDFGLFELDDERIWNNSALARKELRDARSENRREAGRLGGLKKSQNIAKDKQSHSNALAVPEQSQTEQEAKDKQNVAIHTYINTDIHTNNSSSCADARARGEEEQEKVFNIFFFERNFQEPQKELDRFWDYYEGRGWKWGEQKIENVEAVARQWTPKKPGIKFPPSFLSWLAKVYDAARDSGIEWRDDMLRAIEKAEEETNGYDLRYWAKSKTWAQKIYNFVRAQKLDAGLRIDYKYML